MDIIKFNTSPSTPTYLESGEVITGIEKKMWTERYREPGEFKFTSPLSSGLEQVLPTGSLISHSDTLEVMIVENHEIIEEQGEDSVISVTGRSFDAYLDERVVGINQNWASPPPVLAEYVLAPGYTWNQAVTLINDHILAAQTIDDDDALSHVIATTDVSGTSISEERIIERGPVSERLVELLAIDDLGIKTIRRNSLSIGSTTNLTLLVHAGTNRTDSVIFTWFHGDIESAEYLKSIKSNKNAALVTGRYVETPVYLGSETGYNRRWMFVDASDLDDYLSEPPTGLVLDDIIAKMEIRGMAYLMAQNETILTKTDLSKNTRYRYREDYEIGDLISVEGSRGVTDIMRVTEYVEIEDENGLSGHPTLSFLI